MEFSDVVQTSAKYKRNGLCGNSSIGSENGIKRNMKSCLVTSLSVTGEQNLIATVTVSLGYQEEEESLLRVIKPGMKLFLYDFEKRLLYEATIGGKLEDIQPRAFGQEISCLSSLLSMRELQRRPQVLSKNLLKQLYSQQNHMLKLIDTLSKL